MSALAVNPVYAALLMKTPPRVVRTEEQNEVFLAALYDLEQRHEVLTTEEAEMAALLTLLIEDFEAKQYELPRISQAGLIEFVLDQRDATVEDLGAILGDPLAATELMHGLREPTTDEIRRISQWSGISPELFF